MNNPALRPGTFKEWRAVLRREQQNLSLWGKVALAWTLLRAALKVGSVSDEQWQERMLVCSKCPVYDPSLRRCRPYDGSQHGCGCFCPWLALVFKPYPKPGCWAKNHLPGSGLGWL